MSTEFEDRKEYIRGLNLDDVRRNFHYKGKQIDENLSKEELLDVILCMYKKVQFVLNHKNTMCEERKAEDERGIEW